MPTLSLLLLACRPPVAPEGLDNSVRYLFREFYAEDAVLGAGLTGLMNWYDDEGVALLGQTAALDDAAAFTLAPLAPEDVAHLPLEGARDLEAALGVVAVAEMSCPWTAAEAVLVRADQHVVFEEDFDAYERTYLSSRGAFESARAEGAFPALDAPIEVFDQALPSDLEGALLLTENRQSSTELGVTLAYGLTLHMRHGVFEVQGEDTEALLMAAHQPAPSAEDNGNSVDQVYTIELNLARPGGHTLRILATWVEVISPWLGEDSSLVVTSAVNKTQASSERLAAVSSGGVTLPPE